LEDAEAAEDGNYEAAMDAMSQLGMEEDDAYTVSSRTTAFGYRPRRCNTANPEINQANKIKSSPTRSRSESEIKLPKTLVKWRTHSGKPRLSAQIHQLSGKDHWKITKHYISEDGTILSYFTKMSPFMAKGELAFPTYVLDQSLMTEEDYNWHCRLLQIHPKSISHIRSIKKVLSPEDLSSHWYHQDIALPYLVHQQLATEADGDEYFHGPTFVYYPEDGSWHLHLEMVALTDGYEAEVSRQCPFVQVAHAAPQAQDAPQAQVAPQACVPAIPAVVNRDQGVQQMEIDENNFDSAIRAGVAAAAASLPTPQNATQAASQVRPYSQIRVNDGSSSVSSSVRRQPKRNKISSNNSQSSRAQMPPPPSVNMNHTNMMPPTDVQFQQQAQNFQLVRTSPGPTPGVATAAGWQTNKTPPSYKQNQPPAVRTTASPFMRPVNGGSPFQEVQQEDIDDDDAVTIYEEQTADSASYARQQRQQQQELQQKLQQANMPRVVTATPCKPPAQNHFTNMGPHAQRQPQSTRSVRSGHSLRSNHTSFSSQL